MARGATSLVFKEIVNRLRPTSWNGSLATELEARLTLLDQLDITAVPALAVALDATKATLNRHLEAERRRETEEESARWGFESRSFAKASRKANSAPTSTFKPAHTGSWER
jgi:hypothetical protein